MSSMDLFEDGFPHSTPAGYEAGCRGSHCPGKDEHGFSCSEAHVRYAGDYGYRRRVDAGEGPAEIAQGDAEERAKPVALKQKLVERSAALDERDAEGQRLVAAAVAVAESERAERQRLVEPREKPPIKHGTPSGYQRGCRDGLTFPKGEDGKTSCLEAYRAYQRDYAARRRANRGEALGSTRGMRRGEKVEPSRAEATAREIAAVVDALPAAPRVLVPSVEELQRDLAARDARIAELQEQNLALAEQLNARSQSVSVQVPGSVMLRIEVLP